jgi:hypothetical protein
LTFAADVTWRNDAPAKPCLANSVSAAPRMRSFVEKCVALKGIVGRWIGKWVEMSQTNV